MVKVYDAKTILTNLCYDVNRMVHEDRNPDEVLDLIESKILFLRTQRGVEIIRWWNKKKV